MKIAIRVELYVKDDLSVNGLEGFLAHVNESVHAAVSQRRRLAEQPGPTGYAGIGGPGACLKIRNDLTERPLTETRKVGWVEVEVTPS